MLARGEYGARVGVPWGLELLRQHAIPATFFIPGHAIESFPHQVDAILAAGHEVGHHNGTSAPSKVLEIWTGDVDWMDEHVEGGVLTTMLHPQVIGRGHRIAMLERFIEHCRSRAGLEFARLGDVALRLSVLHSAE